MDSLNINILRGLYSGKGVKIAMIDTGISQDVKKRYQNVSSYFYNYNKQRIEESDDNIINNEHGTSCGRMILDVAPQVNLLSINVKKGIEDFTEESIASGIKFAIKKNCRIISISVGFMSYSDTVLKACKEAYKNGVIVLTSAGHGKSIVFPTDFDIYTIKVIDNQDNPLEESINRIDNRSFEVSCPLQISQRFDTKLNCYVDVVESGSSIACAYFAGILSLYVESKPFMSKDQFLSELFLRVEVNTNTDYEKPRVDSESVFCSLTSLYDCVKYKDLINKNFIGIYDIKSKEIRWLKDAKPSVKSLYIINPLQYQRTDISTALFENKYYIGNFETNNNYMGKTLPKDEKIRDIKTPIILVVGVGQECNKFNVQLELHKQLTNNSVSHYNITYNPLGYIFDMDYLKYPNDIPFHDIVYSINRHVKEIEDENDFECFLIDVAGGMFPLNRYNTNNFGMIYNSYLSALSVDYIVICSNSGIETEMIKKEISRIKSTWGIEISIVISNLNYDELGVENSKVAIPHFELEEVINSGIETYRKEFDNIPILNMNQVEKGELLHDILSKLR